MQVFLIRHSDAVDAGPALPDPARFLSGRGRQAARAVGQRLRAESIRFDAVVASPLVRAVQTAELVAAGLQTPIPVAVAVNLAPAESDRDVIAMVQALAADAVVVLVGHEPGLSGICAVLLAQPDFAALGKAEAVRISDGKLRWRFAWDAEAPSQA